MLSKEEHTRYERQLILPKFGEQAQNKLRKAKVFIAGAGGLGAPVCYYLAAAGIGHLVVCDRDKVELSNLNRQILHATGDISVAKANSAKNTLTGLNPKIKVEAQNASIDENNIGFLADAADIIVDCLDNIETRLVLNKYSLKNGTPIMHAGIDGWTGQLTLLAPPETPCINCLFFGATDTNEAKPVLGAVAGVIGTMQALETIKFLIGKGSLKNTLLYFDAECMEWTRINIQKNKHCLICSK